MHTSVVITVVSGVISWRRAQIAERDHSRREEEGTEGHNIPLRILNICPYVALAASDIVIAREGECYWLLFLSVGISLCSLQIEEVIGHSSVLSGADILSKELCECRILATGECASQFTKKHEKWQRKVPQGRYLLDSSICQPRKVGAGCIDGILLTLDTAFSVHEYSAVTKI